MVDSGLNAKYEIKRVIQEIKNYNKEWRYVDIFRDYVYKLNVAAKQLQLPEFKFEEYHYSASRKTINDVGFQALMSHLSIIEEINNEVSTGSYEEINVNSKLNKSKKVFIVHGRDNTALLEVESIISRVGLEPIILNRMANNGLTLIEKFEKFSDVGFAIILLTPDDIGALYLQESANLEAHSFKFRARQNVIFELGFFYGRLGRSNVCCLLKSNVEKPSDIDGIAYLPYLKTVNEVKFELLQELREAKLNFQFI